MATTFILTDGILDLMANWIFSRTRSNPSRRVIALNRSDLNVSKLIFIPDIDKWDKWGKNIHKVIEDNDYVLIDGTFFGQGEIPNRNMAEIPHPSSCLTGIHAFLS